MTNEKAGFRLRVAALTIDEIILITFTYVIFGLIKGYLPSNFQGSLVFIVIFYEIIDYNYYTLFWIFGGQTPGKKILKIKVMKWDGSPLNYKDAFVRYWIWMIGVTLIGIGYFWIVFEKDKRGWNDIVAKTHVIKL